MPRTPPLEQGEKNQRARGERPQTGTKTQGRSHCQTPGAWLSNVTQRGYGKPAEGAQNALSLAPWVRA